ncbi:MAG: system FeS assembly protein NifU family [Cyanobacteria bacterium RYN_339]|nr:system FeS assembly protein NifU family [Cyanobacteria bacterium RYN_339]
MSSALYNQLILEHNKKPRNYVELPDANHKAEGFNPLCGDHIWLYVNVADDLVESIGFQGKSCAICQASASIMTAQVKGKPVAAAEQLVQDFRAIIMGKLDQVSAANQDNRYFAAFAGIANLPARVKCAVLPWHTLHSALLNEAVASTEGAADPVPGSGQP